MRSNLYSFFIGLVLSTASYAMVSCSEECEHTAPAIHDRDSVPVMTTYGVSTLISGPGVIKYRTVTERWEINRNRRPSRWTSNKGILFTQFDLKKHVVGYIQCGSAVYFGKDRRWELRERMRILTAQGLNFYSNELYWDERNHEMWSYSCSHLKMPDKELQENWFHSDEQMTNYEIRQTKGWGISSNNEFMSPAGSPPFTPIDTTHVGSMKGPVVKQK